MISTPVSDDTPTLVITAPEPIGSVLAFHVRGRMTLGTLTQMIAESRDFVMLSSPFIQDSDSFYKGPLYDALRAALRRGVDVDVISTGAGLAALNHRKLCSNAKGTLRRFQPKANYEDARNLGSHAKFCVTDGIHAYVGSANLTVPGLTNNIEMGILVHGDLARKVADFWQFLSRSGFLVEAL